MRATGFEPARTAPVPVKSPRVVVHWLPRPARMPISPRPLCVVFEEREGRVLGPPVSSSSAIQPTTKARMLVKFFRVHLELSTVPLCFPYENHSARRVERVWINGA